MGLGYVRLGTDRILRDRPDYQTILALKEIKSFFIAFHQY